jgi:DNA-binding SARP family transcriptional activator
MEFRVLGLLDVLEDGRPLGIGRGKEGVLLAVLVTHVGRPLSVDRLIDALWGQRAPQHAVKTVQIYISRLRRVLGRERIETTTGGYLLRADPSEVDAGRFEQLASEGQRLLLTAKPDLAEAKLREAIALWRGDAYADFRFDTFAQPEIGRLEELRASAAADLIDARLALGEADELIAELGELTRTQPLWERPRGQLMLALYRSGRQAEALDLYRATRSLLLAELAIEPGPELQALERRILNQAPQLQRPARSRPTSEGLERAASSSRGTFVGRSDELGQLRAGLGGASLGQGRLFLLAGDPGIGKSRLLEELAFDAREGGFRVLVGRCWEAGGAPAFWPWAQALRGCVSELDPELLGARLGSGAAALAGVLTELRERIPGLPEPGSLESDAERFQLFDAMTTFLRLVSETTPVVLVLDDLHAADEPSLLLLRFVARELGTLPMLVVGAYRDVDPVPSNPLIALQTELAGEPTSSRLHLGGLSEAELAEYLDLVAASIASPQLAAALHRETDGNALFAAETVRLLALEGLPAVIDGASRIRIPETVRDVIARRLDHLSPECNRILEVASVLGREFDLDALAAAAELSDDRLLEVLDEAVASRVVADLPGSRERLRFAHVVIRDTIYERLPLARRGRLHTTVFEALEQLYGRKSDEHLHKLASHAFAAREFEKSVGYARRAGDHASSLGAFDEAARLYRLTLDAVDAAGGASVTTSCELLLLLGQTQMRAGESAAAKTAFIAAADRARQNRLLPELAHAAAGYGGPIVWVRAGGDALLVPLLEEGLAAVGDDAELRVRLLSRLAGALRDEPDRTRRDKLSSEALELAQETGNPTLLGHALMGRGFAIAGPDTVAECLELGARLRDVARGTGDRERVVSAHAMRVIARLIAGDLEEAQEELVLSRQIAEELRQMPELWEVTNARALVALATGELAEAEQLIEEARALGERALPDAAIPVYQLQRAALFDFHGGLENIEPVIRDLAAGYPARPVFSCALAYVDARLGRLEDARRILDELGSDRFSRVPFDLEWLFALSLLAETASLVGDGDSANMLSALLEPWGALCAADVGEGFRGSVSRDLGLLAATTENFDAASTYFADALAANERMGARPWLAHTQRDYGKLLLRRGGTTARAREFLDRALATYLDLGMAPHAHEVEILL